MGLGRGSGKARARDAAVAAISSPLLDLGIERATGIVWNITGGKDLTLHEVNEAAEIIYDLVDPNALIIFGAVVEDTSDWLKPGEVAITIIATGFSGAEGTAGGASASVSAAARGAPAAAVTVSVAQAQAAAAQAAQAAAAAQQAQQQQQQQQAAAPPPRIGGVDIPDFLRKRSRW
jgi:cell division protein FtsZ